MNLIYHDFSFNSFVFCHCIEAPKTATKKTNVQKKGSAPETTAKAIQIHVKAEVKHEGQKAAEVNNFIESFTHKCKSRRSKINGASPFY